MSGSTDQFLPSEQLTHPSGGLRPPPDAQHEPGPGDTYAIPADTEHSIEIIEDAEEAQVFTPAREDFR